MLTNDPFPPSDFDAWAETYDQSTREYPHFPFGGYERVLQTIVAWTRPQPGQAILDLGTGTANLAVLFAQHGCELWGTDFSPRMLAQARQKLPNAQFAIHDLRAAAWPPEFDRRFDGIVSAYVFHHFELEKKVSLCGELVRERLAPGGRLVIGDLSFPSLAAKELFSRDIPDWEEEFYWLADESVAALQETGLRVAYQQVSGCAGIYQIQSSALSVSLL
jgi:putative AdoMet-dependent methyltransferase